MSETSEFTVTVPVTITRDSIENLLVSAFEGGSHYWARIGGYDYNNLPHARFIRDPKNAMNYLPRSVNLAFGEGTATLIEEFDDNTGETIATHRLDRAALERGLVLLAGYKVSRYWQDVVNETVDCETGDVFLQLALLGEVRYG